jgi:hypothetical protein
MPHRGGGYLLTYIGSNQRLDGRAINLVDERHGLAEICVRVAAAVAGAMLNPFMAVEERLCPRHSDAKAGPRFRAQPNLVSACQSPFSSALIKA